MSRYNGCERSLFWRNNALGWAEERQTPMRAWAAEERLMQQLRASQSVAPAGRSPRLVILLQRRGVGLWQRMRRWAAGPALS